MNDFYPLTVSKIERITDKAVSVSFTIPENLKDVFNFIPGQYITFKHRANGEEIRRAYSICTIPGRGEFSVGIKKIDGGTFSVFANDTLKEGDVLEVMAPQGRFVFEPNSTATVLAFAAGSGITPVLSIITAALQRPEIQKAVLVYGNQRQQDTMFLKEIEELQQKYTERFACQMIFSKETQPGALYGRIEKSTVNFTLNKHLSDLSTTQAFICGPEEMIRSVESALLEKGFDQNQVSYELFTEPEVEAEISTALDGQTQVEVTLDDEVHRLNMDQKDIILDVLLNKKIDAPYSCQGGVCSTCIARVTEGTAAMLKNQILTDGEIKDGLILTCQAHPTSASLKLNYDDV